MTKRFTLLGDPVAHSLSPCFQNAALRALGLNGEYTRTRVVDPEELVRLAEDVRRGALGGANITLPHKAAAAALADQLEPEVRALGVANTWYAREGALWAANTDVHGARMTVARVPLDAASRVAVFGAGGAAPAALLVLDDPDRDGLLVNRSLSRAEALLSRLKPHLKGRWQARAWGQVALDADLVVDATSLAHASQEVASAAWAAARVRGASAVSLSYGAGTRPFFESCAAGASALDGLTMLLHQGAASFERWWCREAPLVEMREALARAAGVPHDTIG